jgi:hypothetical protein
MSCRYKEEYNEHFGRCPCNETLSIKSVKDLENIIEVLMFYHGPDMHIDGSDIIASTLWPYIKKQ